MKTDQKIGQRNGFSAGDIEKIRQMYNCTTTTSESGYTPIVDVVKPDGENAGEDLWSMLIGSSIKRN